MDLNLIGVSQTVLPGDKDNSVHGLPPGEQMLSQVDTEEDQDSDSSGESHISFYIDPEDKYSNTEHKSNGNKSLEHTSPEVEITSL